MYLGADRRATQVPPSHYFLGFPCHQVDLPMLTPRITAFCADRHLAFKGLIPDGSTSQVSQRRMAADGNSLNLSRVFLSDAL